MPYSQRVVEAFALAHELHHAQTRKQSDTPYIIHLTAVAGLVGDYGGTEDQFIAALLHDAVEDQGGQETLTRIRDQFGEAVARMVWDCSDTDVEPKPPWRARKEASIEKTRGLPGETKLVIAADKLHNGRTILMDGRRMGDEVFERFKGKREGTLWYYREMVDALSVGWDGEIIAALEEVVEALHEV